MIQFSSFLLYTSRKATLLLPPSEEEAPMPSDEELDDYGVHVEDVMTRMAAVREEMFSKAAVNITDAQKRYKKDYDKRKSRAEVNVNAMIVMIAISPLENCFILFTCTGNASW